MPSSKSFCENDIIILLLYIDDMLIVRQDSAKISNLKNLVKSFAMKDLGMTKQILGMFNCHDRGIRKLWVSQKRLVIVPHGGHFK